MFKINESIIVIQAEATSPNRTNVVFWSHDRGTAKLRMKLVRKNGIPQSLPEGTTVPIRLMFRSATAEGGYGKHDYLATIEDRVNGIVSIVLEDNILGYVGTVEGSVYIDLPNDRSLDTAGRFTFDIKHSPIDDSTPELEDYYFNGFSQTIDKIEKILADGKQEIEQKITESETQIDAKVKDTNDKITKANQDVATLNTNIDKANDRIDQTNQQIGDLGKLKKMYSNSIDFGDYDYSGNPNLSAKLNASSFSSGTGATVADDGDEIVFTLDGKSKLTKYKVGTQVPLIEGKQYTISCEIMLESDFVGDPSGLRLQHAYADGGAVTLATTTIPTLELNTWQKLSGSAIIKYASNTPKQWYNVFINTISGNPTGKVRLRKIKIEEGPTATPYQLNLLDDPYWIGKAPLGENLIDPTGVTSSSYLLVTKQLKEKIIENQTYTITLKGTKPATQAFRCFVEYESGTSAVNLLDMKPVEGLVDEWQLTFKAIRTARGINGNIYVYQVPNTSVGQCKIDWFKVEKGNTRTPNISEYKYFGEGLKDSNNPNDYSWDVTPEYAEKALTNTLNLTDPQTALGLKNFKDGAQIDGVDVATVKNLGSVLQSGSGLATIQSDKQSAFDEFSYEFERIGDRVFFHARVRTNSTTAVASHVNLLEIPLGFQFPVEWTIVGIPLSVVQWTTPQGEISALVITDSTGKQVVKFATNRVGNHYISGEWRTADSYPETK
ncbi:BppU family phage baseplate upper protein [Enterococcus faecium]|uniref:BppU family phage baseplate upper protein n=1 Tax=Enterococcus faecium TaxID=1352 RepID=UPI001784EF18|nr:BppU family phage baseplate upper protein [Enterococcus faecium]MBD9756466.1 BppU family phage baseplate upper protein [Enterococcus faecium]